MDVAVDSTPTYGYADAIVDVARVFLDTAPEDRSGEDRTVVMVHVAAEHLTSPTDRPPGGTRYPTDLAESLQASTGVPVGTPPSDRAPATGSGPIQPNPVQSSPVQSSPVQSSPVQSSPVQSSPVQSSPVQSSPVQSSPVQSSPVQYSEPAIGPTAHAEPSTSPAADLDVPAGTPMRPAVSPGSTIDAPPTCSDPTCQLQGLGGIEPETARRLACDAELIGAVVDINGEVLALGRSRRLVSRAQRRALMIRDGMCQFTACHQTRHLQAHHIIPWSAGGPTDLDNLILLCRFHHTAVHEGGMTIERSTDPSPGHRWDFLMPDGRPHQDWYDAEALAYLLAEQSSRQHADHTAIIDTVDRFDHPEARRILPGWRGERFDLHECVQALFRMQLRDDSGPKEEWTAA